MKKRLTAAVMAVVFATTAWSQQIKGAWHGQLDLQVMKLNLVFHFNEDGTFALDSPDQGAKGIGCLKEYLSDDSLAVRLEMINASYRACLK